MLALHWLAGKQMDPDASTVHTQGKVSVLFTSTKYFSHSRRSVMIEQPSLQGALMPALVHSRLTLLHFDSSVSQQREVQKRVGSHSQSAEQVSSNFRNGIGSSGADGGGSGFTKMGGPSGSGGGEGEGLDSTGGGKVGGAVGGDGGSTGGGGGPVR